jgi:hypothetical protein
VVGVVRHVLVRSSRTHARVESLLTREALVSTWNFACVSKHEGQAVSHALLDYV